MALGRYCTDEETEACTEVIAKLDDLWIVNRAYKGDELPASIMMSRQLASIPI
jgi:hypothetical protein